jgi:hypothetical protein
LEKDREKAEEERLEKSIYSSFAMIFIKEQSKLKRAYTSLQRASLFFIFQHSLAKNIYGQQLRFSA